MYWPWKNFTKVEMACPCCGEMYIVPQVMDMLQTTRHILGFPVYVNSAHRCRLHNIRVGGVPFSQHRLIAIDISKRSGNPQLIYKALCKAGFTTFGFYNTFIHTDPRPGRSWATSKEARRLWTGEA